MRTPLILACSTAVCAGFAILARADEPVIGESPRYVNPLPMISDGGSAAGDVTVIRDSGTYYMYCTGGGAWVSENMLDWTFHRIPNVPVAPDVVKYNGNFYMSGNSGPLLKADNPLGPFTSAGDWPEPMPGWYGPFDMHIFVDDDNQPYLYYPGRGVTGIFVVKLDPDDLSKFAGKPKRLFTFNPDHVWERYGEMNEYTSVAWIEGPWMHKQNGIYYLEYSASGTQWKTYAEGYYTADSPTGPFAYAPNSPLLRRTTGLVTGTAHGSIVEGPDGNPWQFYTIVLSNPPGGRRVGMDPIRFDGDGLLSVRITDTPQWAPGVVDRPGASGDSGSVPVSINKVRAMNARSSVSSEQSGHEAAYAVDNESGTWWASAPDDAEPSLTLDLGPATEFDVVQLFEVDSVRLMFSGGGGRGFGGRGFGGRGRGNGPPAADGQNPPPANAYQYRIEVSTNGEDFATVFDASTNDVPRTTIFNEFSPTSARFVRLRMTNWPRTSPLGVIELTVFGRPGKSLPAQRELAPVE
jgi:xylan 1,4-beta-xylosidase